MVVATKLASSPDAFSSRYATLIESSYDCVDRIVINAYNPLLQQAGGFRHWWRQWQGSDEGLHTNTLMRMAGRFAKRVRAYAQAHEIPVVECDKDDRKHELVEAHLPKTKAHKGCF